MNADSDSAAKKEMLIFLSVAVWYLFRNRPGWRKDAAIGKTFVTSSMIDRVANHLGRKLFEVPVGFKWFVAGSLDGSYGFAGEESAGASLLSWRAVPKHHRNVRKPDS